MVKEKRSRIYDDDGYRRRAACICVKNEEEKEVLLVSSSHVADKWIIPGGGVEPGEEPSVAAVREVKEEAGVVGKLGRFLGIFENAENKRRTSVYVFTVTEELAEWDDSKNFDRKRKWFTIKEALDVLSDYKPIQCSYLKLLNNGEDVLR